MRPMRTSGTPEPQMRISDIWRMIFSLFSRGHCEKVGVRIYCRGVMLSLVQ